MLACFFRKQSPFACSTEPLFDNETYVRISAPGRIGALVSAIIALTCVTAPASAQGDSITIVPSDRYQAGSLHRFIFGDGYREMWGSPLRVELLDFPRELGGLTPIQRGGNVQTMALRF